MFKGLIIMTKIIPIAQKALNYIWTRQRLYVTLTIAWIVVYAIMFWTAYAMGARMSSVPAFLGLLYLNYYVGKKVRAYVDSKFPNDASES